jgi:ArsR family transcriptional regulator
MFRALGDPTRLQILEYLGSCCCSVAVEEEPGSQPSGAPTVGDVCCCVTGSVKVTSTMSFHLKELRNAGLITMERRGKNMICQVKREVLASLGAYFIDPTIWGTCAPKENDMNNETCCCGDNCQCGPDCPCRK